MSGWNRVAVVAPVGFEFGIVEDADGRLTLAVRIGDRGEQDVPADWLNWRAGQEPKGGLNQIAEGATRYVVVDDGNPKREVSDDSGE